MLAARPVVEIRDLSLKYPNGVIALQGINLDINPKDFIALIGPNGAGKSTLLKIILGLIKPTSGTIKLYLTEESASKARKASEPKIVVPRVKRNLKYVGYVPQSAQARDPNLPFSVFETVMLGRTPIKGLFHRTERKIDRKLRKPSSYLVFTSLKTEK